MAITFTCPRCKIEVSGGADSIREHVDEECSALSHNVIKRLTVENKKLKSQLAIAVKGIKALPPTRYPEVAAARLLERIEARGRRKK